MFDFFGKKKITELSQLLLRMEQNLDERERRALRRQKAIEDALSRIEAKPETIHIEALMNFAENFALSCRDKTDEESEILLAKTEYLLSCFGLAMINETLVEFDPDIHEACMTRHEPDFEDNSVVEIIRPGFVLNGEILRHAVVVVNKMGEISE